MPSLAIPGRAFAPPRRISRFLFQYEAADGSPLARTGQPEAFSRASRGVAIDSTGRIRQLVHSQPRYTCIDADGDGVRETYRLLEGASSNLFTRATEFEHADWTKINCAVTTAAAIAPDGTLTARKITCSSNAAASLTQDRVVSATHCSMTWVVKKGSGATHGNRFVIADVTAGTNPLAFDVNYDTGAITYVTGSSGANVRALGGGWWIVSGTVTGLTSGHTIRGFGGFGGNVSAAGNYFYAFAAQLEALPLPTSPILPPATSRSAESLTYAFDVPPRAMTVYHDAVWYCRPNAATNYLGWRIGNPSSGSRAYVLGRLAGSLLTPHVQYSPDGAVTLTTNDVLTPVTYGHRAEMRAVIRIDDRRVLTLVGVSVDGGPESVSAAFSTPVALATQWGAAQIQLTNTSQPGYLALRSVRIAPGERSLDYMRSAD